MPSNEKLLLAMTVEKLLNSVRQVLCGVINLHIDILVMEANVSQLIAEVKQMNAELQEVNRLDKLIGVLRDYGGPTICHEWPYPQIIETDVEEAVIAATNPDPDESNAT